MGGYAETVSGRVADAMSARGVSEVKLAEMVAAVLSRSTLQRRLAGSPFNVNELAAIAAALDISVLDLMAPAEVAA